MLWTPPRPRRAGAGGPPVPPRGGGPWRPRSPPPQLQPIREKVNVAVGEAGEDGAPAEVDAAVRGEGRGEVRCCAGRPDPLTGDGPGLDHGPWGVERIRAQTGEERDGPRA